MERKSISKKLRFEVFKRDKFTCQYCGRMSPDVTLEIDHINPVSNNGDNDIMNLVTSCFDCNRGKGKKTLSDDQVIKKQQKQLLELSAKTEQLEMMIRWKKEMDKVYDKQIDYIESIILEDETLSQYGRSKIREWIRQFGFELVEKSSRISFARYSGDEVINKIGGICYNIKKQSEGE